MPDVPRVTDVPDVSPIPDLAPGLRLICRLPDGTWLVKDRIYVVAEVVGVGRETLVGLQKVKGMLWWPGRFEIAPIEKGPPAKPQPGGKG
jgi:hypothetical protein